MCKVVYVDWIKGYEVVYECIYYWNIIVFVKVILLFVVVMLDFLMVRKFFCVDNKWQCFWFENQISKESWWVMWIVIVVVVIFFLVEIFIIVIFIFWMLFMVYDKMYVFEVQLGELSVIFNIIIYIFFFCILFLYCLMSKKFWKYLLCGILQFILVRKF